jgi:vacuolar-type H+-ATPase subunit E/Vma4
MMPQIRKQDAEKVRIAGQKMSNWLYNMAQHSEFNKLSAQMKEMVAEWDCSESILRRKADPTTPAK